MGRPSYLWAVHARLVVLEYTHVHNKYNPIQEAINLGVDGFGRVWRHGYWEGPDEGKGMGK